MTSVKFGQQGEELFDTPIEVKLDGLPIGSHSSFCVQAEGKGVDIPQSLLESAFNGCTGNLLGAKDLETGSWLKREDAVTMLGDLVKQDKEP